MIHKRYMGLKKISQVVLFIIITSSCSSYNTKEKIYAGNIRAKYKGVEINGEATLFNGKKIFLRIENLNEDICDYDSLIVLIQNKKNQYSSICSLDNEQGVLFCSNNWKQQKIDYLFDSGVFNVLITLQDSVDWNLDSLSVTYNFTHNKDKLNMTSTLLSKTITTNHPIRFH